jgi:hypothetical protein
MWMKRFSPTIAVSLAALTASMNVWAANCPDPLTNHCDAQTATCDRGTQKCTPGGDKEYPGGCLSNDGQQSTRKCKSDSNGVTCNHYRYEPGAIFGCSCENDAYTYNNYKGVDDGPGPCTAP